MERYRQRSRDAIFEEWGAYAADNTSRAATPTVYENNQIQMDSTDCYAYYWVGQTFRPAAVHTVTSVRLELAKVGSPEGDIVVSIRATDASGSPSGDDLASGALSCSSIKTTGNVTATGYERYSFDLGAGCTLQANTLYAICWRVPGGNPGNSIWFLMNDPLPPPDNNTFVGLVYQLGPEGATFGPPANLTVAYDPEAIPPGVDEENLAMATWDELSGNWVEAKGTVDTVSHAITSPIGRLGPYGILAHIRPAALTIEGMTVSPETVEPGQTVNITANVTNNGDLPGPYEVVLSVDGIAAAERYLTVTGGVTQVITLSIIPKAAGKHDIAMNGLTGSFTVLSPTEVVPAPVPAATMFTPSGLSVTPTQASIGENVTIGVWIANSGNESGVYVADLYIDAAVVASEAVALAAGSNRKVTFQISRDVPGVYSVELGDQTSSFEIKAPEPRSAGDINWWMVGGVVLAAVVILTIAASLAKPIEL